MKYKPLTKREEEIACKIVDCAYKVHSRLGPGLLESVYEACFCHELREHVLSFERQIPVPIVYAGMKFESALRLDVLVENTVVCELKSVEVMPPIFDAQLLSYMKLTAKRLGFLINFNVSYIKDGIKRKIL